MDLKEEFVLGLVNQGIRENQVRLFLADKGAYQLNIDLIAHCIRLGASYERPLNFVQDINANQLDHESDRNYNDFLGPN